MHKVLSIHDLEIVFALPTGEFPAVRGISFDIPAGGSTALVGESGSGKSVTAQAILRLLPEIARINRGEILFYDTRKSHTDPINIATLPETGKSMQSLRGASISIIFQEPSASLSPLHTIGDQISEALFLHRQCSHQEGMELTRAMLELVRFPDPLKALKAYPFELSGGLKQRAMIAMALVCRPALLIADEPTTALDVTTQAQILKLLKEVQQELQMALLMITHDLGVVANIADHVVVMYHGEIMEAGTVDTLFHAPKHPYLKALFSAVPHFDMQPGEKLTPLREIHHDATALMKQRQAWTEKAVDAGPHLKLTGLAKTFELRKQGLFGTHKQTVSAVCDVSLDIMPGECFGLVGESGCGKSTLAKLIMRGEIPDAGNIIYNNRGQLLNIAEFSKQELLAYRNRVQLIFQDPYSSLNPRMTVFDIIREPLQIHHIGNLKTQTKTVKALLRLVGLDPRFLNRYPHSFSGGQRQRIVIARALALSPDLLICDEPVSALDVSIQAQILNLLKALQNELGLTYLFISHNLAVVNYVANTIAVMCAGRIVEIAPRDTLFQAARHPYTRALLAAVPYPDLEKPLDHEALESQYHAATPSQWPAPFLLTPDSQSTLYPVGNKHWVRATHPSVAAI